MRLPIRPGILWKNRRNLGLGAGPSLGSAAMSAASAPVSAEPVSEPLIRIRSVLLVVGLIAAAMWLHPRALAAWQLHSSASALADYALCMVGPTGPALLRDNPAEFRHLVRRRLVASEASERPFGDCAAAARQVTGSVEVERAHRAQAWSFVEYGGVAADRARRGSRADQRLDDLAVSTKPVAELSKRAWPFVRGGYIKLIKPSLSAKEAMHPVELPTPSEGRGLPAWRAWYRSTTAVNGAHLLAMGHGANLSVYESQDGGINWTPAPLSAARDFAGRCLGGERSYTFGLDRDAKNYLVASHGADGAPSTFPLARADAQIFAAACDDRAVVAAVKPETSDDVTLFLCPYRSACSVLEIPPFGATGARPRFPLDVARVDGVTVVAAPMHELTRVTSTRDDGKSWTPYSVAFDGAASPYTRAAPGRLLTIEKRVMLYGGAPKPGQTYPVLFSDDYGASWRSH